MSRFSLVLHTHMPYVEGFGTWPFGEEWLWEAIAMSYLPLLDVLDDHPGKVTLSLTPVLADQLEATGALDRCLAFLRGIRPASHALDLAERPEPGVAAELERSAAAYAVAADALERRGDLLAAFGAHVRWTSPATHPALPLLATDAGVRLQLETGIAAHRARFGEWGGGLWLPECAHASWLDELLEEAGVHLACVDWTDVLGPGVHPPQRTDAGVTLIPLHRASLELAWSPGGYPAHGDYRDSHRLTARAHKAWANDGGAYDHARALERARADARHFAATVPDGAVVAFDTEFLGHHWYEGVGWLRTVLEEADVVEVDGADPVSAPADPPPTSWGEGRDLRTWSTPDIAWAQRAAELTALGGQVSDRALRELLALQSSDWAFGITHRGAGEYPRERAEGHHAAFAAALAGEGGDALRHLAPHLARWAFVQP